MLVPINFKNKAWQSRLQLNLTKNDLESLTLNEIKLNSGLYLRISYVETHKTLYQLS